MKLSCTMFAAVVLCGHAAAQPVTIAFLGQDREAPLPVSPLDKPMPDSGLDGARLAIADNVTTGRFTGQTFALRELVIPPGGDAAAAMRALAEEKIRFVVADLNAEPLLAASASAAPEQIIINSRGSSPATPAPTPVT